MLNPRAWGLGGGCFFERLYDPVTLTVISTLATVAGTAVAARGTIAEGKAAQVAANYEAQQLDIKGKEEQAAAQREAEQLRRQKNLALSKVTARSAASGFSATDPSTLAISDEIEKYGTVQEQMAMHGGTSRRAGLEAQATAARFEGRQARKASRYKAAGTILSGVSTLASRFNPPKQTSAGSGRYG